jgi:hypothetical protein
VVLVEKAEKAEPTQSTIWLRRMGIKTLLMSSAVAAVAAVAVAIKKLMAETPTAGTAETPMVATLRHKINPKNGFLFLFSVNCPFYNFIRIIIMVLRVFVYQFFKFFKSSFLGLSTLKGMVFGTTISYS